MTKAAKLISKASSDRGDPKRKYPQGRTFKPKSPLFCHGRMASYGGASNRPAFNPYGQRSQPPRGRGKYQSPRAPNSIFSRLGPATTSYTQSNCPGTNADNRISGVYYQLNRDDSISLPGQVKQLDHRMQETAFQSADNTEKPVSRDWADDVSNISCTPSPPTLQKIAISEKRGFGPPPLIRVFNPAEPRFDGGSALVVQQPEEVEWPPNTPNNPSNDTGNRCFQYGVGSILSSMEPEDRGVMEPKGVETPHQLQRTSGCLDCPADLCKHPQGCTCSHQDRQHFSSSLYKSHGRGTLSRAVPDSDKYVELVLGSRSDNLGRTSTRNPECHGRLRVQEQEGPVRVGVKPSCLLEDCGSQGRMPGRSICLPPVSQTSNILQLEARPRCVSSRRSRSRLKQDKRVYLPPLFV